ncbi:hypothetical protein MtrunA17_Chr8g0349821 [Medicago truncatula]|uniref:Uncharacterized protein n=1 Tax=Medicago truncatula TaxID=3880 RepID=A0A396GK76_MEDTR|nr:hypothetical protein MtrunA17_Chr8g0349821 [Medicago truncatula]
MNFLKHTHVSPSQGSTTSEYRKYSNYTHDIEYFHFYNHRYSNYTYDIEYFTLSNLNVNLNLTYRIFPIS